MKQRTGPKRKAKAKAPKRARKAAPNVVPNMRHEAFVREYLVDLNGKQAAIRAGYTAKTAHAQANRLLKRADIAAAVEREMAKRAQRIEVKADDVLRELASIAFSDVTEVVSGGAGAVLYVNDLKSLPVAVRRCIESVSETQGPDGSGTLKVKLHSKVAALKMLMDHLGMNAPTETRASVTVDMATREEALEELRLAAQRDPSVRAALEGK